MKKRNVFMCGVLAAVMLFAGCKGNNSASGTDSKVVPPADTITYAINSASNDNPEGNQSDVTSKSESAEANLKDVTPKSGDLIATFEIEDYGTIKAVLFPEVAPVGVENFQKLCDAGFYKGLKIHRVVSDFMFQGGSTNGDGTGGAALVNGGKFSIETAQNARHFYGALCYANAGADNNSTQFYIVNNKKPQDLSNLNTDIIKNSIDQCVEAAKAYEAQGEADYAAYYNKQAVYYQTMLDWFLSADDEIKARYKEKGGTPSLDGNYTVFGQVYEGFDVIDELSNAEVKDNGAGEISKPVKDIIIKNVSVSTFE